MSDALEISIVVCTYQLPRHLSLCLNSIARQTGIDGRFEVIVADDGSTDETSQVVDAFSRRHDVPVRFVSGTHHGCRSRCRNAGILAATAPYLLLIDGDCVLPHDHVRIHLDERQPGTVCGGNAIRLSAPQSERAANVGDVNQLTRLTSLRERWRVIRDDLESSLTKVIPNPNRPKLFGNNIGIWKHDLERVNGFDEKLIGWGGDDDDLRLRLRQANVTIRSIARRAPIFHLWHPRDPAAERRWSDRPNAPYLQRPFRITRCVNGLEQRRVDDLSIRVRNGTASHPMIAGIFPWLRESAPADARADIECLLQPGRDRFSGNADCNVLILTESVPRSLLREAHILVTDLDEVHFTAGPRFRVTERHRVVDAII